MDNWCKVGVWLLGGWWDGGWLVGGWWVGGWLLGGGWVGGWLLGRWLVVNGRFLA